MPNGSSPATANRTGTLEWITHEIGVLLNPLPDVLSPEEIRNLMYVDLGVNLPAGILDQPALADAVNQVATTASRLPDQISALNTALNSNQVESATQQAAKLIQEILATVAAIAKIVEELQNLSLPGVTDAQLRNFATGLAGRILEVLEIRYLDEYIIKKEWLLLFGLLDQQLIPIDPQHPDQGSFVREALHLDRLFQLLKSPIDYAKTIYAWGTTSFQSQLFLERVKNVLALSGLPATLIPATPAALVSLEFLLFTLRENRQDPLPGLELDLKIPIAAGFDFSLPISSAFSAEFSSTGEFEPGLQLLVLPPSDLTLLPVTAKLNGDLQARLVGQNADTSQPIVILGATGGSRLEATQVTIGFGLSATMATGATSARGDVHFDADIVGGKVLLDTSGKDRFLSSFLPDENIEATLDFGISWTPADGIRFKGGAGLEIVVPLNLSIGPLQFQELYLSLSLDANSSQIPLEVSAALSGQIGPVTVTVDRVGFEAQISLPQGGGNVGPVDFSLAFKAPSGAGLAIDAAGVSGGGFLAHDDAEHEYSGVLQLQFNNLALQAFGLITTQVAGQTGYSLLAMIDADFPPIQLGWGFTLNGVGGLMAVHRTASVDALRAALKADKLSAIMFPKNAITNAPQILAALDTFFPIAPGRFLFGPMALIGWGTPTMMTAAIAIIIELPEPVSIILLARIAIRMPSDSKALVRINMDALGVLDLGQSTLSLDASLFDSRLLDFTLSGDMALRANWSGEPREFLLSIGGFHPRFTPPANFPTLKRLSIDMSSGSIATLHLESYLAITSNTLQVGANLHMVVKVSSFSIDGHLGFDALFQRNPFHFDGDISGSVSVSIDGYDLLSVSLDANLTGPAPWQASGKFTVHIVFFDVSKSFSHSWGNADASDQIAAVDVGALVTAELADPRSWGVQLPTGTAGLVTARNGTSTSGVVAHPLAQLEVHERTAPLGIDISRFGGAPVSRANRFTITDFRIGGAAVAHESVEDDFAPAEFLELTDDEKLAQPSFEQHDAGVRLTGGLVASGAAVTKTITYETFYVDQPGGVLRSDAAPRKPWPLSDLPFVLLSGSAGRAAINRAGNQKYTAPGSPIHVANPAFVLVNADTLAPVGVGPVTGSVYSDVRTMLEQELTRDPSLEGRLQIVATHELVAA